MADQTWVYCKPNLDLNEKPRGIYFVFCFLQWTTAIDFHQPTLVIWQDSPQGDKPEIESMYILAIKLFEIIENKNNSESKHIN